MAQFDLTNFNRFILDTENDADSPDNEELMQQYMYNLVGLLILMLDTGISGTATADPTNVANSVFVDAAAVWTDDLHNGRTLLITSGTGKGLFYLINATDDAANSLTLNDNLFADGVRNGDGYKILYDLKTNLDGHDHDGVNSKLVVGVADDAITLAKLKTLTHEQSSAVAGVPTAKKLTFADYGFECQVKSVTFVGTFDRSQTTAPIGPYVGEDVVLTANAGGGTVYCIYRYVSASGEILWIWILRDKNIKKILSMDVAADHCSFGLDNPSQRPHPFEKEYDPTKHEIVLVNPDKKQLKEMYGKKGSLIEVFLDGYEVDEKSCPEWPKELVTTKILNDNWFEAWIKQEPVEVEKKIIPKVDYVLCRSLKKKKK